MVLVPQRSTLEPWKESYNSHDRRTKRKGRSQLPGKVPDWCWRTTPGATIEVVYFIAGEEQNVESETEARLI